MTGAAFTIGAGNMNAFKFILRVVYCFAKRNGIVQVFFIRSSTNTAKHGQVLVEILDRLLIIHLMCCIQQQM